MNKLNRAIIFLFVVLSVIVSVKLTLCIPTIFNSLGFDSQNLLVWRHSAIVGQLPYKDVFYPYGLLNYWKETSFFWRVVSILLTISLFVSLLYAFLKLFKNKLYAYIVTIIFYVSTIYVTGISSFARYGVITALAVISIFIFYKNRFLPKKILFLIGVTSSLVFFLLIDQGIYVILFFSFFIFINPILKSGFTQFKEKNYYQELATSYSIFVLGFFIASLPFIGYFTYQGILFDFVSHLHKLSDISEYAKTPYLHSLRSLSGIFNIAVLFLSISYLSIRTFFVSRNYDRNSYIILSLIFVLLLLEQKSIIRSIDNQLVFISILLLLTLFYNIVPRISFFLKKSFSIKERYMYAMIIIVIGFSIFYTSVKDLPFQTCNLERSIEKISSSWLKKIPNYSLVLNKISQYKDFNGKIFSFPGDPLFYILFKQNPPYYFTIYEASPEEYKKKRIQYINENKVDYIIYNLNIKAIQDGVPDLVRGNTEANYILSNFHIIDKVENFLILRRNESNEDFFKNPFLLKYPDINSYFSTMHLGHIPKSEGIYKKRIIDEEGHKVYEAKSIRQLNKFLANHKLNSKNLFFIFTPNTKYNEDMHFRIKTKDNHTADVYFDPCDMGAACVVNLSRIPLFNRNRRLSEVIQNGDFRGKIEIITGVKNETIW